MFDGAGVTMQSFTNLLGVVWPLYVYGIFLYLDHTQTKANRAFIAGYIRKFNAKKAAILWRRYFYEYFQEIFGSKHLSLKCIMSSLLFTVSIGVSQFAGTWLLLAKAFLKSPELLPGFTMLGMPILGAVVALIPINYLLLYKTRILLRRKAFRLFDRHPILFAMADLFSSAFFALIAISFGSVIWMEFLPGAKFQIPFYTLVYLFIQNVPNILVLMFTKNGAIYLWQFMFCVLFPSIWLWAALFVVYIIRSMDAMLGFRNRVLPAYCIDLEERPLKGIGSLVFLVLVLFIGAFNLGSYWLAVH